MFTFIEDQRWRKRTAAEWMFQYDGTRKLTLNEKFQIFAYINEGPFMTVNLLGVLLLAWFIGIVPFSYADEAVTILFPAPERIETVATDYYRSTLNSQEQELYDQFENAYRGLKETVTPHSPFSQEDVMRIQEFVLYDNPDIFWAKNSIYMMANIRGVSSVALSYHLTDRAEIQAQIENYETIANEALVECESRREKGDGETATASLAYMWIIEHTDYSDDVSNSQNIDSVFGRGDSVCAGYSKAMKYLMDKCGVPCVFVVGGTSDASDPNHAWNIVKVDDAILYVDSTWGDKGGDSVKWKWFATDPNVFAASHFEEYPEYLHSIWGRIDPDPQIGRIVAGALPVRTEMPR